MLPEMLPISVLFPLLCCLPPLNYVAWEFLPLAPYVCFLCCTCCGCIAPHQKLRCLLRHFPNSSPGNPQLAWGQRRHAIVAPDVTSPKDCIDPSRRLLRPIPCCLTAFLHLVLLFFFLVALGRHPFRIPGHICNPLWLFPSRALI